MSYRPITDMWFLARAKLLEGHKYYGAYLGGFPERARVLLGATINEPVLHVCGGKAKYYPYKGGFGPNDKTVDMDPEVAPDYLMDVSKELPKTPGGWRACLADPPYSEADADCYNSGAANYPRPGRLVEDMLKIVQPGGRVGLIHYALPKAPEEAKFVACIGIVCGFNNRIRVFSVFERLY